jgi:adenylylsulfate kinase-like enzyme
VDHRSGRLGQNTLSRALVTVLRRTGQTVVHVDGDQVRTLMGGELGYTTPDRLQNAWRIARLCAFLQAEGVLTVCSTMSLYPEIWRSNRERLEPYLQVLLDVPMNVLVRRDQKGLYSGIDRGTARDVGGLDLPLELPRDSDLILQNGVDSDLAANVATLVLSLERLSRPSGAG